MQRIIIHKRAATLKEARYACAELERDHQGRFFGIYKGHRDYVVTIINPSDEEAASLAHIRKALSGSIEVNRNPQGRPRAKQ